jgi:hypothetical protein
MRALQTTNHLSLQYSDLAGWIGTAPHSRPAPVDEDAELCLVIPRWNGPRIDAGKCETVFVCFLALCQNKPPPSDRDRRPKRAQDFEQSYHLSQLGW